VSAEEKTEQATPQKRKKSRKEGQVARSAEIGPWAAVLVVALLLDVLTSKGIESVQALLTRTLAMTSRPSPESALLLLGEGGRLILLLSLVLGLLVLVVSVIGAVAQGGLFFATKLLKPKWSRLSPLQGAKRLFGPHALWEGAKMLVKSAMVAFFVWRAVKSLMPVLGGLVPIPVALDLAADAATGLMRDIAFAALLAAGFDYAVQRRKTGKQVRMTKKEVKDEHKQSEGDPLLKGQIRSR
jgi:flagellar biosynthesis protein FlhB